MHGCYCHGLVACLLSACPLRDGDWMGVIVMGMLVFCPSPERVFGKDMSAPWL